MILNLEDVKDILHDLCDNFPVEIRIRTGYPVPFRINNIMSRPNPDRDVIVRSMALSEITISRTCDEFLSYEELFPHLEEIYDRLSDYDYTIQFSFNYGSLLNDLPDPKSAHRYPGSSIVYLLQSIHILLDNSSTNEGKLIKRFINF